MDIENAKRRLLDSEQELSYSQRIAIVDLIERLRGELESRDTILKDFAETIALFDSQSDRCPECGIWRDEEMKEHKDHCTVNKIDEWLS